MTTTHSEAPTLVHEPAGDNSLAAELLARRRKRLPALTIALVVLVAAAAAFVGGIEAQKHWGSKSSSANPFASALASASGRAQTGANGFPNFSGGRAGFPSGFGGAGGGTSGTVTLIKGSTLYVTDASGNTVLVHTSATSRVSKTVSTSVKTIHPGDTVTVVGSQAKDGSYTARQVTIGGSNG
ncbi:MAG: hypothetical protein ACXVRU_04680 [Gaiellaceae bacterium]